MKKALGCPVCGKHSFISVIRTCPHCGKKLVINTKEYFDQLNAEYAKKLFG